MFLGKKFPVNLRAFRFVVIELLRRHVEELGLYEMECWLSQLLKASVLVENWIENFMKPLFLMLYYVHAER